MKRIIGFTIAALFLVFTGCSNNSDNLDWNEKIEPALQQAKQENKTVFINFTGSDWCQWCQKLSAEVFTQEAFEKYAEENLVLVRLDFPRQKEQSQETVFYNRQMAQRYNVKGFPTIVLLNPDGKVQAVTGYQYGGAEAYVQHIESLL